MSFAETPNPDEDKWGLRERMIGRIRPGSSEPHEDGANSSHSIPAPRFQTLFRPRPAAPIKRSLLQTVKWRVAILFGVAPKGLNDNWNWTNESLTLWNKVISHLGKAGAVLLAQAERASGIARQHLHMRRADLVLVPAAIAFFILPLLLLIRFDPAPNNLTLASVLIGSCYVMSALLGPRFGTIATISTCIWLSYKTLPATSDMDLVRSLTHWLTSLVATGAMAAISFALGSLSTLLRNVLRLGRQAMKREADIEAFQTKLKRAHNADQILSYLVGYCRDEMKRRVIFLALDESASSSESPENVNIAARLKVAGYARVVVNRRAYVPRAIQSYKSSGFEPFTLETPSGVIGLLGLDTSNGKVLSSLDRRYLKLLLVSTAYALERITLIEKLNALDESQLEFKTRNATLLNLIANISNTTHNLDDQTHSLKQLLDREPSRPYETAMNFIRRNISALRNSIALLRDVAS